MSNAAIILGIVSDATSVDDYILLENLEFCALLKKYADNNDIENGSALLINFVNNNF